MTLALDHVQLAMPQGGEAKARAFFGELLGLREIEKPTALAGNGGCWFALGSLQLHVGVDADFRPAKKAHIAIAVDDLAEQRTRCEAAGHPVRDSDPVAGRARLFSEDPFGNRIEFIESIAQ